MPPERRRAIAPPSTLELAELEPHELRGWLVALALGATNGALQDATARAQATGGPPKTAGDCGLSTRKD